MKQKSLAVVLVNYNGKDNTLACLESLRKLKWSGSLELIVVDNHSHDGSAKVLRQKFPNVVVIKSPKNLGFGLGNNLGAKRALQDGAELVMLLNNDTVVDANVASELFERLERESAGVAVPKIYFYKGFEFHKDWYREEDVGHVIWYAGGHIDWNNVLGVHDGVDKVDTGQFNQSKSIEFATGCCMMITAQVIEQIGLFDDAYFLYLEDADFSKRVHRAGFRIVFVPQAKLWHKNAESTGGSGSSLQDYYFTRNRMLFGFRFAPLKTKLALTKESLRLLIAGRPWQRRGIIDFYFHRFGKGSYPIKE